MVFLPQTDELGEQNRGFFGEDGQDTGAAHNEGPACVVVEEKPYE